MTPKDLPPRVRKRTVAKARTLLEALPFIQEHWGRTIVATADALYATDVAEAPVAFGGVRLREAHRRVGQLWMLDAMEWART